ncbi:MAG: Zn-dependent exopeptidase M28 [Planctomycetes bacterium]|nr:Zn-dependent exopeptidase M28 [Planctomycetota bacterium]
MGHARAMVAFGPRPSGSPALLRNRDYIRDQLKALGLPAHEQNWDHFFGHDKKKLRLHNVWTEIPGQDPTNGPILIVAAHYDTKLCSGHDKPTSNFEFVGAIDGAGGSAVLLELARVLKSRKSVPNVWLVWFDGEESRTFEWDTSHAQSLVGSRYFVETMQKDKTRFPKGMARRVGAMVLLDLIGSKNPKVDRDLASNSTLLGLFEKVATETLGRTRKQGWFSYESPIEDDHYFFKQNGIKVIDLIDFHYRVPKTPDNPNAPTHPDYQAWWHTADDNLAAMDPASLKVIGDLLWFAMPELEKQVFQVMK